jgi:hypothetical protein
VHNEKEWWKEGIMESETPCACVMKNREHMETQREWLQRCMCMHHWSETDYYQSKLPFNKFFYIEDKKDERKTSE